MAQGVISTFLRKVKLDESLTVYGNGNAEKDYIYISDLIELTYELTLRCEIGEFNIGSGMSISLNQIINEIITVTGKHPVVEYIDSQSYDVNHFVLDVSKVTNYLGIRPAISLSEGIGKLWNWIDSIK